MNDRKTKCSYCHRVHIGKNVDSGVRLMGMVVPEFRKNANCKELWHGNRMMYVCTGCYEKLKDTEWWKE